MRWHHLLAIGVVCAAACEGKSQDAEPVEVGVRLGVAPEAVTSDLGYTVRLTRARMVIADLEFTRGGEMHAAIDPLGWLIGQAQAHPGHNAGGTVTGEMPGLVVLDLLDAGADIGAARVLQGPLEGANFALARGSTDLGLSPDDPLIDHTFDLAGEITRDGAQWTFTARVEEDADRRIIGAPCPITVGASTTVHFHLYPQDPYEPGTLFDGLDWAALDADGDSHIDLQMGDEAYNRLRRSLQTHDYYAVTALEETLIP